MYIAETNGLFSGFGGGGVANPTPGAVEMVAPMVYPSYPSRVGGARIPDGKNNGTSVTHVSKSVRDVRYTMEDLVEMYVVRFWRHLDNPTVGTEYHKTTIGLVKRCDICFFQLGSVTTHYKVYVYMDVDVWIISGANNVQTTVPEKRCFEVLSVEDQCPVKMELRTVPRTGNAAFQGPVLALEDSSNFKFDAVRVVSSEMVVKNLKALSSGSYRYKRADPEPKIGVSFRGSSCVFDDFWNDLRTIQVGAGAFTPPVFDNRYGMECYEKYFSDESPWVSLASCRVGSLQGLREEFMMTVEFRDADREFLPVERIPVSDGRSGEIGPYRLGDGTGLSYFPVSNMVNSRDVTELTFPERSMRGVLRIANLQEQAPDPTTSGGVASDFVVYLMIESTTNYEVVTTEFPDGMARSARANASCGPVSGMDLGGVRRVESVLRGMMRNYGIRDTYAGNRSEIRAAFAGVVSAAEGVSGGTVLGGNAPQGEMEPSVEVIDASALAEDVVRRRRSRRLPARARRRNTRGRRNATPRNTDGGGPNVFRVAESERPALPGADVMESPMVRQLEENMLRGTEMDEDDDDYEDDDGDDDYDEEDERMIIQSMQYDDDDEDDDEEEDAETVVAEVVDDEDDGEVDDDDDDDVEYYEGTPADEASLRTYTSTHTYVPTDHGLVDDESDDSEETNEEERRKREELRRTLQAVGRPTSLKAAVFGGKNPEVKEGFFRSDADEVGLKMVAVPGAVEQIPNVGAGSSDASGIPTNRAIVKDTAHRIFDVNVPVSQGKPRVFRKKLTPAEKRPAAAIALGLPQRSEDRNDPAIRDEIRKKKLHDKLKSNRLKKISEELDYLLNEGSVLQEVIDEIEHRPGFFTTPVSEEDRAFYQKNLRALEEVKKKIQSHYDNLADFMHIE